jgi:hypothetical protein
VKFCSKFTGPDLVNDYLFVAGFYEIISTIGTQVTAKYAMESKHVIVHKNVTPKFAD